MSKARKVFVVIGLEDGLQGVYSNKKLAYESAVRYTSINGGPTMTYSKMCKVFKTKLQVTVDSVNGYGSARIEEFDLNAIDL